MSNSRIYDANFLQRDRFKGIYDNKEVSYNETYKHIRIFLNHTTTIKDWVHARVIKRKLNFKDIIPGDVYHKKVCWVKDEEVFGMQPISSETGKAIERNGKIIWYSMPGKPNGTEERKVITEKTKKIYYLYGIIQKI